MGDVVHCLPAVSDIARAFPQAQIDWVVEEAFAEIPRLHLHVARVIPIAVRRWRRRFWAGATWREARAALRELRAQRYDAIVDCQGLVKSALVAAGARGAVCGPAASCAREPLAACFYGRRLRIDPSLHAVERNRRLCAQALGYGLDTPEVFGVRERAALLPASAPCDGRGAVLLFTNTSRTSKRWPDGHWVALESALAQQGRVSWLAWGSAQEREDCARRVASMRAARLLPRSTLAQVAALASRAALVVGLDTGLTHLAAAVGAPTVGIFCDYDTAQVGLHGAGAARSLGGVGQTPAVGDVLDAAAAVLAPSS